MPRERTLTRPERLAVVNRVRFELDMLTQMIGRVAKPEGTKAARARRYYRRFFRQQARRDQQFRLQ